MDDHVAGRSELQIRSVRNLVGESTANSGLGLDLDHVYQSRWRSKRGVAPEERLGIFRVSGVEAFA